VILNHARRERLEVASLAGPLLGRHSGYRSARFPFNRHNFAPDVVGLAGFNVQLDHRLSVGRPAGVLSRIEMDAEVAAVLHAG